MIAGNNCFQLLQWAFYALGDIAITMIIVEYALGYFKPKV